MRNLALTLSFDGAPFFGYQYQPHVRTVQQSIQDAWNVLTGETPTLNGCSRLDAQVNANHFVLSLQTETALDEERIVRGLNGVFHHHLKEPVWVHRCEEKPADFHARFSSVGKHYRYKVWYGFGMHRSARECWIFKNAVAPTDVGAALKLFEGHHNFEAFRASDCTAQSALKTLHATHVWSPPHLPEMIVMDFWGRSFLKNMIRNLAGTALYVASGKLTAQDVLDAFEHGDRTKVGPCAPGHALCLERVFYDLDAFEASAASPTR